MQRERNNAYKLIAVQTFIIVILSSIFLFSSFHSAYSVLLGGLCCILPSIYFARKLFHCLGAQMARQAIKAFYFGEVIKLIMIGVISIFIFMFITIDPLAYFIGFIIAQFAFWVAPHFIMPSNMESIKGVQ